jgi:hypothetical protein
MVAVGETGEGTREHRVQLAVSPLKFIDWASTLAGATGLMVYHTSVVVDGMEFSFSPSGICAQGKLRSHKLFSKDVENVIVTDIGTSSVPGKVMHRTLRKFFQRNTYDALRKNCNSFTDVALGFLVNARLDDAYRGVDKLGAVVEHHTGLVQSMSRGLYTPNPKADGFDLEQVRDAALQERLAVDDGVSRVDTNVLANKASLSDLRMSQRHLIAIDKKLDGLPTRIAQLEEKMASTQSEWGGIADRLDGPNMGTLPVEPLDGSKCWQVPGELQDLSDKPHIGNVHMCQSMAPRLTGPFTFPSPRMFNKDIFGDSPPKSLKSPRPITEGQADRIAFNKEQPDEPPKVAEPSEPLETDAEAEMMMASAPNQRIDPVSLKDEAATQGPVMGPEMPPTDPEQETCNRRPTQPVFLRAIRGSRRIFAGVSPTRPRRIASDDCSTSPRRSDCSTSPSKRGRARSFMKRWVNVGEAKSSTEISC